MAIQLGEAKQPGIECKIPSRGVFIFQVFGFPLKWGKLDKEAQQTSMFNICQGNIWDVEILKLSTSCNHKQRIINSWFISKSGIIKVLMHEIKKKLCKSHLGPRHDSIPGVRFVRLRPNCSSRGNTVGQNLANRMMKTMRYCITLHSKIYLKKNICIVAIICIHLPQQTVFSNFVKSIYWLGLWNLVAPVRSARGGVQWSFLFHVISVNSWFKVMYIAILGHTFQIYVANCFCLDAHTYDTMGYVF